MDKPKVEVLNAFGGLQNLDSNQEIWLSVERQELNLIIAGLQKVLTGFGVRLDIDIAKELDREVLAAEEMATDESRRTLGMGALLDHRVEFLKERQEYLVSRQDEIDAIDLSGSDSDGLEDLRKLAYDLLNL